MFRVTSTQTSRLLVNPIVNIQRGYASKLTKFLDEKLVPPKKPLTAYIRFHKETLNTLPPEIKTKVTEASKVIGERWRNLTEAEKKTYYEAAEKGREEYQIEYKRFMDSLTAEDFLRLAQVRRASKSLGKSFPKFKDPNAPKKPATAYVVFLKEKYSELFTENNNETFRKIAEQWRQISEEDRKYFEERAAADRIRYDEEIRQYKLNN